MTRAAGAEAVSITVVQAQPLTITQRTSEAVTGVPARAYLESLRSFQADGGTVSRLGKLRVAGALEYVAWLKSRTTEPDSVEAAADGAEGVLREVGLRVLNGGGR